MPFVDVEIVVNQVYRGMVEVPDFQEDDDKLEAWIDDLVWNTKILKELDPEEATIIDAGYDLRD